MPTYHRKMVGTGRADVTAELERLAKLARDNDGTAYLSQGFSNQPDIIVLKTAKEVSEPGLEKVSDGSNQ
jgi:hypothetical protein